MSQDSSTGSTTPQDSPKPEKFLLEHLLDTHKNFKSEIQTAIEEFNNPNTTTTLKKFLLIEDYQISSYLLDYGAGRTIKTFSLLPGEKTTIKIRSYRNSTSTNNISSSVTDSASREARDNFQKEINTQSSAKSDTAGTSNEKAEVSVEGRVSFGYGSASAKASGGIAMTSANTREEAINNVTNALSNHSATASRNREISVDTTGETTVTQGTEDAVERTLHNINVSSTQNFVFRQVNQRITSLVHLTDLRVALVYTSLPKPPNNEDDEETRLFICPLFEVGPLVNLLYPETTVTTLPSTPPPSLPPATLTQLNAINAVITNTLFRLYKEKARGNIYIETLMNKTLFQQLERFLTPFQQQSSAKSLIQWLLTWFRTTLIDKPMSGEIMPLINQAAEDLVAKIKDKLTPHTTLEQSQAIMQALRGVLLNVRDNQGNAHPGLISCLDTYGNELTDEADRISGFKFNHRYHTLINKHGEQISRNQENKDSIRIPGIIMSQSTNVIRTDGVVVDVLMGQGLALDEYTSRIQANDAEKLQLNNERLRLENEQRAMELRRSELALNILETGNKEKADLFQRLFPQSTVIEEIKGVKTSHEYEMSQG